MCSLRGCASWDKGEAFLHADILSACLLGANLIALPLEKAKTYWLIPFNQFSSRGWFPFCPWPFKHLKLFWVAIQRDEEKTTAPATSNLCSSSHTDFYGQPLPTRWRLLTFTSAAPRHDHSQAFKLVGKQLCLRLQPSWELGKVKFPKRRKASSCQLLNHTWRVNTGHCVLASWLSVGLWFAHVNCCSIYWPDRLYMLR